jgi:hypothetical protein
LDSDRGFHSEGHVRTDRRDALNTAKAAVRSYARDPSQANAIEVDIAWRRVRALEALESGAAQAPPAPRRPGDRLHA